MDNRPSPDVSMVSTLAPTLDELAAGWRALSAVLVECQSGLWTGCADWALAVCEGFCGEWAGCSGAEASRLSAAFLEATEAIRAKDWQQVTAYQRQASWRADVLPALISDRSAWAVVARLAERLEKCLRPSDIERVTHDLSAIAAEGPAAPAAVARRLLSALYDADRGMVDTAKATVTEAATRARRAQWARGVA